MFRGGDKIGEFEIVAPLKAGGMATLYVARRSGPAGFVRPVAIKVVHSHLTKDEQFIKMFFDEARLSARIHHPNVVHVEELGEQDGAYFLAMEYVHGCSLSHFLRHLAKLERALSPELAVYVAMEVAEGLHAAHETRSPSGELLHVVHRDVSPQNVLLAYSGHVKLIDFGVAKAAGRSAQTTAGSIKGKLRYMSPEQAWGHDVDRRSDVYALGIVLWEMLTRRRIFGKDMDLGVIDRVRNPDHVPPSVYVPRLSPDLDTVVMHALAVDPAERFDTAQAFRRALANASTGSFVIDSEDLSQLLSVVMRDEIEKQRRLLPESITKVVLDGATTPMDSSIVDKANALLEPTDSGIIIDVDAALAAEPGERPKMLASMPPSPASNDSGPAASDSSPSSEPPTKIERMTETGAIELPRASRVPLAVAIIAILIALVGVPVAFLLGSRSVGPSPSPAPAPASSPERLSAPPGPAPGMEGASSGAAPGEGHGGAEAATSPAEGRTDDAARAALDDVAAGPRSTRGARDRGAARDARRGSTRSTSPAPMIGSADVPFVEDLDFADGR